MMPHPEEAHSSASQNVILSSDNNPHAVLDAYDTLALARDSEIYLDALVRYIYQNVGDFEVMEQLFNFLRIYRTELNKGLNRTAELLQEILDAQWKSRNDD